MRYALRSQNTSLTSTLFLAERPAFEAHNASVQSRVRAASWRRLAALGAGALSLQACASLGLGGSEPAAIDAQQTEIALSAAEISDLKAQLASLKNENAALKKQVKSLEAKYSASTAKIAETEKTSPAPEDVSEDTAPKPPVLADNIDEKAMPIRPIVSAAGGDAALADVRPPVESSPKLVQPSFSDEKPVFENEAKAGEIQLASVLFGVHLASYRKKDEAREGWRSLQRQNPDELGLLEPRVERVDVPKRGVFYRLIGGGFSAEDKAAVLCERLENKGVYCSVAGFAGERLTFGEAAAG